MGLSKRLQPHGVVAGRDSKGTRQSTIAVIDRLPSNYISNVYVKVSIHSESAPDVTNRQTTPGTVSHNTYIGPRLSRVKITIAIS